MLESNEPVTKQETPQNQNSVVSYELANSVQATRERFRKNPLRMIWLKLSVLKNEISAHGGIDNYLSTIPESERPDWQTFLNEFFSKHSSENSQT